MRGMSGIFSIAAAVLRTLVEIEPLVSAQEAHTNAFDVEATVTLPTDTLGDQFSLTDGAVYLRMTDGAFFPRDVLRPGDRIRARGALVRQDNDLYNYARATRIDILAHGEPPPTVEASIPDLLDGRFLNRPVRTQGTVIDVFRDEIDPRFVFLILFAAGDYLYVASAYPGSDESLKPFLQAQVSVSGHCTAYHQTDARHALGLSFAIRIPEGIRIIRAAASDPFDVPDLAGTVRDIRRAASSERPRRKVTGIVRAVWQGKHVLLGLSRGEYAQILLASTNAPAVGMCVEAVGMPETDVLHRNLTHAVWRLAANRHTPAPGESAVALPVTARELLTDAQDRRKVKPRYEGRRVRMQGTVRKVSAAEADFPSAVLETGGHDIPLDFSSRDAMPTGLTDGCQVEVSGICVLMTENGQPLSPFPRVKGFRLVCGKPDDIHILVRPPWWTPTHSLVLIGALLVGLAGILVWNVLLQRLSDRKGRALAKARLARDASELKVRERTRLATELHDTIVQNLTGAVMGLRAADRLYGTDRDAARRQIRLTARALDACRDELRNCIWDLRSCAFDEPCLEGVLRRTLAPLGSDAQIGISLPVLRTHLADGDVHALVCIIRELVLNAIRHGQATAIRIDGHRTSERLVLSVTDDGCGFDITTAPGISDGHYGLQGVRERVEALHGRLSLSSALGRGTTVSVDVPLPGKRDATEDA